jgi:hypothetical protein
MMDGDVGRRPADTFGARLAVMRQAMGGWNVKKVADHCGINDQVWRNWEAGIRPRDYVEVCRLIAERLDFEFEWVALGGPLDPASTGWLIAA